MNKFRYLITFISLFLANSHISLAQELSATKNVAESKEICGKTLSSILVIEEKKAPELKSFMQFDEEYCDVGFDEIGANYEISYFDALKKKIYSKRVFLNQNVFIESFDFEKDKFTETEIIKGDNSRILKVPVVKNIVMYDSYSIKSLDDNKEGSLKKIILSKEK